MGIVLIGNENKNFKRTPKTPIAPNAPKKVAP